MALQPSSKDATDRTTTAPFLLRLFWRPSQSFSPHEFSVAPPADTSDIPDYTSLLPAPIRQQSVQIYTWPTCTLSELTGLLTSVLPDGVLPQPSAGTRLVYKLIFPDTRGAVGEDGRGKWTDRPLGNVVIGTGGSSRRRDEYDEDEDAPMANGADSSRDDLTGDADKTLADARFVIGDYVACTIYPPTSDGRIAPLPPQSRGPRDPYVAPRGPPGVGRENGYGPPRGGGYRGGYGGRGGGVMGTAPPMSDWRRGERPPGPMSGGYGRGGGYRGGRGRPY